VVKGKEYWSESRSFFVIIFSLSRLLNLSSAHEDSIVVQRYPKYFIYGSGSYFAFSN